MIKDAKSTAEKPIKISAGKKRKIDIVKNLMEKFSRAESLFLTDYQGLSHKQLEALRKALKKAEAEFLIIKNTLIKIALAESTNAPFLKSNQEIKKQFEQVLTHPTAAFLTFGDQMAALKVLAKFIKDNQLPKIKLGIFEGKLTSNTEFMKLAALPSREELVGMLLSQLKSPIYGFYNSLNWNLQKFVILLNAIKSKKVN